MNPLCQASWRHWVSAWYHIGVRAVHRGRGAHMGLGENLRRLRTARYLSQSDLATKARVSKPTILRIERGDYLPYPRTIRALAVALEVEPSELIAAEELAQRGKAAA